MAARGKKPVSFSRKTRGSPLATAAMICSIMEKRGSGFHAGCGDKVPFASLL
jgi:hypothetical protein